MASDDDLEALRAERDALRAERDRWPGAAVGVTTGSGNVFADLGPEQIEALRAESKHWHDTAIWLGEAVERLRAERDALRVEVHQLNEEIDDAEPERRSMVRAVELAHEQITALQADLRHARHTANRLYEYIGKDGQMTLEWERDSGAQDGWQVGEGVP